MACAVILDQDEKIFVGKRLSTILGGHWEFPGGKVKTNESILQALKREIFEELGVEVIIGQSVIEPYTYHYQFADVLLYFYFAKLKTKSCGPKFTMSFLGKPASSPKIRLATCKSESFSKIEWVGFE